MDSYIVRIYRRGLGRSSQDVAGLIEEVGTDQRKSFQTVSGMITTIRKVIGRCEIEHADVHALRPDKDAAISE